ncbi:Rab-GTPase-TBC domain-containing protein [Spironucleus salmonicida]|uniref:Rab-GTPase-TBC domain-containing protein n=1 Tax=Spironucleus salmonicida TaxID=348837 RepID=V6LZY2_9EUKA|nr:Rab-GTPase-TBC domain-containing protein [Spironucleus salmonicida]|eukprot:EST46419.1 hypothetical protein SS50377_13503 [Spironucleus salmonicida]
MSVFKYFNEIQKNLGVKGYTPENLYENKQHIQIHQEYDVIKRENIHLQRIFDTNYQNYINTQPDTIEKTKYFISEQDIIDSIIRVSDSYFYTNLTTQEQSESLYKLFTDQFQISFHDQYDTQVYQKSFQENTFHGFNDVERPQKYKDFTANLNHLDLILPQTTSQYTMLFLKEVHENLSVEFQLFKSQIVDVLVNFQGAPKLTNFPIQFPYQKISVLIAPFLFLYDSTTDIINIFSKFYRLIFHKLHDIETLLFLVQHAIALITQSNPALYHHFKSINFQVSGVLVKFFLSAFSQMLSLKQVFAVWDRMVQSQKLEILSAVAAKIVLFKAPNCFGFSSAEDVERYLLEIDGIDVFLVSLGDDCEVGLEE